VPHRLLGLGKKLEGEEGVRSVAEKEKEREKYSSKPTCMAPDLSKTPIKRKTSSAGARPCNERVCARDLASSTWFRRAAEWGERSEAMLSGKSERRRRRNSNLQNCIKLESVRTSPEARIEIVSDGEKQLQIFP